MPEGLPWVILEAMSAKLPVITTNQGAIPDVVVDGNTGYIVPPEEKAVADSVCHLIEEPVMAKRMGENGYKRVVDVFSEDKYLAKISEMLERGSLSLEAVHE